MNNAHRFQRIVVLTPGTQGTDGVSVMSQLVASVLARGGGQAVKVWSLLDDTSVSGLLSQSNLEHRSARGSKARFVSWGIASAAGSCEDMLVFSLHLHLAPAAVPLIVRGATFAQCLHGVEAWTPLAFSQALAVRRAKHLIAFSEHTARRFKAANPTWAAKEVLVCPLGVAERLPHPSSPPPADGAFALIVARMAAAERYKGHDLLLEIWPSVLERVPTARLVVVGDGDDRERLVEKARYLSLDGCVEFLGRVSRETLGELYRNCAFFVMPSRDEGFGLVYLEAMQNGIACIAAQGAAAEIVVNEVTGLVVDLDREGQLREAIVRLFQDPQTRRRMGQAGLLRVEQKFREEHFHQRLRTCLGLELSQNEAAFLGAT